MVYRLNLKKKGLDLCVEIIDYLVNVLHTKNIQVDIVGDGPDLIEFNNLIKSKGLDAFFNFLGYQKDVYGLYAKSDIAILTSRWEGFGLTAAEAALAGLPAVAFDVPGLNEVIIDKHTGLLISDFNIKKFAKSILQLNENFSLRKNLGVNAKAKAKNEFDKESVVNRYLKIYKKLL